MAENSYFIETEFSEYESEVFAEEQIKDTFISVLRTVNDEDEGLVLVMGASEPIGDFTCISAIVYGDHCRVELYEDFNERIPDVAKDLAFDDAIASFIEFFNGKVPDLDKRKECGEAYTLETEYTDFPVPVRDRRQILECLMAISTVCEDDEDEDCCDGDDEDCCCEEEDCCCDECCDDEMRFVVLQAPAPVNGVDFVQATPTDCGWYVEMSFLEGRRHQNFGTFFDNDEDVIDIFCGFLDGTVPETEDWIKVRI